MQGKRKQTGEIEWCETVVEKANETVEATRGELSWLLLLRIVCPSLNRPMACPTNKKRTKEGAVSNLVPAGFKILVRKWKVCVDLFVWGDRVRDFSAAGRHRTGGTGCLNIQGVFILFISVPQASSFTSLSCIVCF